MNDIEENKTKWEDGSITCIPFQIEDQHTGTTIKISRLFLHINKLGSNQTKPNWSAKLVAVSHEGVFSTFLDPKAVQTMKLSNNTYNSDQWSRIVWDLLSTDRKSGEVCEFVMTSRFVSSLKNYAEKTSIMKEVIEEPTEDYISLYIKTASRLPMTLGSFTMKLQEQNESSQSAEYDLFNWMRLLQETNLSLVNKVDDLQDSKSKIECDFEELKKKYDQSQKDHQLLTTDLQDKFYQVLNSKKDRIWELQGHSDKILKDLNKDYETVKKLELEGSSSPAPAKRQSEGIGRSSRKLSKVRKTFKSQNKNSTSLSNVAQEAVGVGPTDNSPDPDIKSEVPETIDHHPTGTHDLPVSRIPGHDSMTDVDSHPMDPMADVESLQNMSTDISDADSPVSGASGSSPESENYTHLQETTQPCSAASPTASSHSHMEKPTKLKQTTSDIKNPTKIDEDIETDYSSD